MGYYNRKSLFSYTLRTIRETAHDDYEIVIVDDASNEENRLEDIASDIKLIRIDPEEKTWINPCVAYNKGFRACQGDVILIQNPECCHIGDVISHAAKTPRGNYHAYSCYYGHTKLLSRLYRRGTVPSHEEGLSLIDPNGTWYTHVKYRPAALHFMSAINRDDLWKLNGFDERYANGIAYEDADFLRRATNLLEVVILDTEHPFCIHQQHPHVKYIPELTKPNEERYFAEEKDSNWVAQKGIVNG